MEAECELSQIRYLLALQTFFLHAKTQSKTKQQQQLILVVTCQLVKNGTTKENKKEKKEKRNQINKPSLVHLKTFLEL